MAMSSSHKKFFSSQDVAEGMRHLFGTLTSQKTQKMRQKRSIASRSSGLWWSSGKTQLQRSVAELNQIPSGRTATSLKFNKLFLYPVQMVQISFTASRRRYVADQECTLLYILPAETAELEKKTENLE